MVRPAPRSRTRSGHLALVRVESSALRSTTGHLWCDIGDRFRSAVIGGRTVVTNEVRRAYGLLRYRYGAVGVAHDDSGEIVSLNARRLDDMVNAMFRITLILSVVAESLRGPEKQRILLAVDEMDQLIHDIRQIAFDRTS